MFQKCQLKELEVLIKMAYQSIKFWTYRQGGSMVCDERIYSLSCGSLEELKQMQEAYRIEINYDGRIYFQIYGYSGSDSYEVAN